MPDLVLTRRAKRDLLELPRLTQEAVIETLTEIEAAPQSAGKPLRGRLRGLWSCRIGNYRVLYTIKGAKKKQHVVVRAIRHRSTAYATRRTK